MPQDSTDQSNDDVSHAQSENEQYDRENESDYFSGKGSEDENAIVDNKIVVEDKKKKKVSLRSLSLQHLAIKEKTN